MSPLIIWAYVLIVVYALYLLFTRKEVKTFNKIAWALIIIFLVVVGPVAFFIIEIQ